MAKSESFDFKPKMVAQPERRAPRDIEAERAVLGCLLLNAKAALKACADILTDEDFFVPLHARAWRLGLDLWTRGVDIDLVTLVDASRTTGAAFAPA